VSTTIVASEAKAVPPVISSIQDIPLDKICESTEDFLTNPNWLNWPRISGNTASSNPCSRVRRSKGKQARIACGRGTPLPRF